MVVVLLFNTYLVNQDNYDEKVLMLNDTMFLLKLLFHTAVLLYTKNTIYRRFVLKVHIVLNI